MRVWRNIRETQKLNGCNEEPGRRLDEAYANEKHEQYHSLTAHYDPSYFIKEESFRYPSW